MPGHVVSFRCDFGAAVVVVGDMVSSTVDWMVPTQAAPLLRRAW